MNFKTRDGIVHARTPARIIDDHVTDQMICGLILVTYKPIKRSKGRYRANVVGDKVTCLTCLSGGG